jgi:hypothetical protein
MEINIHIGYPKTGSTAIQSHVSANRGWLEKRGLYVPKAGFDSGFGHNRLLPLPPKPGDKHTIFSGSASLELLADELHDAKQKGFKRCLITWEGFTAKNESELSLLHEALPGHHFNILAYVREQGELFQSAVLQEMEALRFNMLSAIFDGANPLDLMGLKYDYYSVLDSWRRTFSPSVIIKTRIYQRSTLLQNNVVIDFFDWLELPVDNGFHLQRASVNPSLDLRSSGLLLTASRTGMPATSLQSLVRALQDALSVGGAATREIFSLEQRETIWQHYLASNGRLFSEFRPENAPDQEGFSKPVELAVMNEACSAEQWLKQVYAFMHAPRISVWQGNVLAGLKLEKIVSKPSSGWRGPEPNGTWSLGTRSEIIFLPPVTSKEQGPAGITLTIGGHYFGDNKATRVVIGDREERLDLSSAKIRIEFDEHTRTEGIRLSLLHETPQLPKDRQGDPLERGLAFKLQIMSFQFFWK